MPDYEVVTPLSNGRKKPIPTGTIVSLPEKRGAKLVAIGAIRPSPFAAAVQTVEQLVRLGKAKMLKIAEAETIALPEAATAKVMAEAIVAARLAKAGGAADVQEGDA